MPFNYPEPQEQPVPEGWLDFKCPDGWEVICKWGDGHACRQKNGGLRVIIDSEIKSDGKVWIHVSASRANYTPTHDDMSLVKQDFIGNGRYAYSVWPPAGNHVNIHKHCLHLWACLEGDGRMLPEFSAEIDGVGKSI